LTITNFGGNSEPFSSGVRNDSNTFVGGTVADGRHKGRLAAVALNPSVKTSLGDIDGGFAGSTIAFKHVGSTSLPTDIVRTYAGRTLLQLQCTNATTINVRPTDALPIFMGPPNHRAIPVDANGRAVSDPPRTYPSEAIVVAPEGDVYEAGNYKKLKVKVLGSHLNNETLADVELAIKLPAAGSLLEAIAQHGAPVCIIGGKISNKNPDYPATIWLGSGAIVALPPAHPLATKMATLRVGPALSDPAFIWENPDAASVCPQDSTHDGTITPMYTNDCSVDGRPVLPLVLTIGTNTYAACMENVEVMSVLPGFTTSELADNFANSTDADRTVFLASNPFSVAGKITTNTIGRITYITAVNVE
jgi:hypothetical protein